MKNVLNDQKGFTLVELLAVIVILALIMGIAVVAMTDVISNSQKNSYLSTAGQLISGVRDKLSLDGELQTGSYYFTSSILTSGGIDSPLGGKIQYATATELADATQVGTSAIYRIDPTKVPTCSASSKSFITITLPTTATDKAQYTICLTSGSGNKYISGTESAVLSRDYTIIK